MSLILCRCHKAVIGQRPTAFCTILTMIKAVVSALLVLTACGGDDGGSAATPDAAAGPACTGALYDNCVNPSDCMSGMCQFYQQSNFTVCTQACSASNPCPNDSSGNPGTCNQKGICKPAAANVCHL